MAVSAIVSDVSWRIGQRVVLRAFVDCPGESVAESIPTIKRATAGVLGDVLHRNLSGFGFDVLPISTAADVCGLKARITDEARCGHRVNSDLAGGKQI